jgi:hypothetical protein
MEKIKYYEVEFSKKDDKTDMYSICILGIKKPTIEEAQMFLKKEIEVMGYDYVSDVLEITYEEAHEFFDMEREDEFPVFGK